MLFDHERVQRNLFSLAQTKLLRKEIESLPNVVVKFNKEEYKNEYGSSTCIYVSLFTELEQEAAFTLFAILASAYVNNPIPNKAKEIVPIRLPKCIAFPLHQLSVKIGRQPIWDYAGCVLSNWSLVDKTKAISLENIEILRTLTNLTCEVWFYKIHVVIEAYGGQAVKEILKIYELVRKCSNRIETYKTDINSINKLVTRLEIIKESLETIAACVQLMKLTFSRMSEQCKDTDFFEVLRPWLAGWPKQGVIYEGVDETPQVHGGGSGAQSSLLPSLDALIGVSYMKKVNLIDKENAEKAVGQTKKNTSKSELYEFVKTLKRFRKHMPREHASLLDTLESEPCVRNIVALCNEVVKCYVPNLYNPEIEDFEEFVNTDKTFVTEKKIKSAGERSYESISLPLFLRERQRMEVAKLQTRVHEIKVSYNYAIESMLSFRRMHVGFATMYITRQAKKMAEKSATKTVKEKQEIKDKAKIGTGGSSFTKHFMSHIQDTRKCLYKIDGKPRNEYDVDVELVTDTHEQQSLKNFEALREHIVQVKALRHIVDSKTDNSHSEDDED